MEREDVALGDDEMLFMDGCDAALIGRAERCGAVPLAVYDYRKLRAVFRKQGMTFDEAEEWIYVNCNAWLGDHTPLILFRPGD